MDPDSEICDVSIAIERFGISGRKPGLAGSNTVGSGYPCFSYLGISRVERILQAEIWWRETSHVHPIEADLGSATSYG